MRIPNRFLQRCPLVYVLKRGKWVKIGITESLEHRLRTLRTGSPEDFSSCVLLTYHTRDQISQVEDRLHKRLKPWKAKREWFKDGLFFRWRLAWELRGLRKYRHLYRSRRDLAKPLWSLFMFIARVRISMFSRL